MNTEQQTTQNKQHRYTQVNTDIHKTTQTYTSAQGHPITGHQGHSWGVEV
jgi:hypothetical protein